MIHRDLLACKPTDKQRSQFSNTIYWFQIILAIHHVAVKRLPLTVTLKVTLKVTLTVTRTSKMMSTKCITTSDSLHWWNPLEKRMRLIASTQRSPARWFSAYQTITPASSRWFNREFFTAGPTVQHDWVQFVSKTSTLLNAPSVCITEISIILSCQLEVDGHWSLSNLRSSIIW